MAKKPNLKTITSGYAATTALNENFEALRNALDNTVSRDGSVPNAMSADLDLNGNDIINAARILVDGQDYLAISLGYLTQAQAAQLAAEAAADQAELSEINADSAKDYAEYHADRALGYANDAQAEAVTATIARVNADLARNAAQAAQTAAEAAQAAAEAVDVVTDAAIGTVSSLTEGSSATASATALDGTVTFDFGIPVGATGATGPGFTGGSYNASTGVVTFTSDDGLGFSTGDLRGVGDLLSTNNLSDLDNVATARTNLGLGTAATSNTGDFAAASHTHTLSEITDAGTAAGSNISDFAAASHTHTLSEITDAGTAAASDATDFEPAGTALALAIALG